MKSRTCHWMIFAASSLGLFAAGCSGDLISNLVEENTGTVSVLIINNTPFRASFTLGTFDDLDRSPGPVDVQQFRLPAMDSDTATNFACGRDIAIGTQKLVDRVVETRSNLTSGFDDDAFDTTVHFSAAPASSDGAALPDAGAADGRIVRLGVDYTCGDQLIFTFEEDNTAPGGFRIDFTVLADQEDDA